MLRTAHQVGTGLGRHAVGVARPAVAVTLVVLLAAGAAAQTVGISRILLEKDSVYHRIRVHEDASWRYLRFDRSLQGGMLLKDPTISPLRYTDYVHLAWLFTPTIQRMVVVANIVGALGGSNSKLFRAIYKTYAAEIPGLYLFPVGFSAGKEEETTRTILLFATQQSGITRDALAARLEVLLRGKKLSELVTRSFLRDYYERSVPTEDVPVLTDDYAPVDILPVYGWEPERR